MRLRNRIWLFTSLVMALPALGSLGIHQVGERRLANTNAWWMERLMDARATAFTTAWLSDLAGLEHRLARLVDILCDRDVRVALATPRREAVHHRVRERMPPGDGGGVFYVLGSDSTVFAADSFQRVGRRDSLLAAVVDDEINMVGNGNACSRHAETETPMPIVSRSADDVFVWASRRVEAGGNAVVGMVGMRLAALGAVRNGGDLWLLGTGEDGTVSAGWLVTGPRRESTRERVPGTLHQVADVRWLGWRRGPENVRGHLFVGLPVPSVDASLPGYGALLLAGVAGSLAVALLLLRRVAGGLSRPLEKIAHNATIVTGRGRIRRSFRSEGGGREVRRIAAALNKLLERASTTGKGVANRRPREERS